MQLGNNYHVNYILTLLFDSSTPNLYTVGRKRCEANPFGDYLKLAASNMCSSASEASAQI